MNLDQRATFDVLYLSNSKLTNGGSNGGVATCVNTSRTSLKISSLFGVVGSKVLSSLLTHSSSFLRSIDIAKNNLSGKGAKAIVDALKYNFSLTHLNVSHNAIGKEGAIAFAEFIFKNVTLSSLDLSANNLETVGVSNLAEALKGNKSLLKLDLSGNELMTQEWLLSEEGGAFCGITSLAEALRGSKYNSTLQTLLLSNRTCWKLVSTVKGWGWK